MSSDDLDDVIVSYMEMFPDIPIKDVYMFFDEIQLIKDWEYFVLRVYKSYCKNIYVCGSNATMLSTELSSALRGYPLEYETYPLSFNEYCRFKGIATNSYLEQDRARLKMAFEAYNQASAFPEIVLTSSRSEQLKLLHGYFDTMILKDLAEHYKISNTGVVRYFVKRVMANLTKPTSINAIYKDIKSQGLMRGAVLMPQSNDNGKNLENTVFMQLNRMRLPSDKIAYYQGNCECDFVLQREDNVIQLIQVTWDMVDASTREREIKGLLEAASVTGCENLIIVTKDEENTFNREGKEIKVIPAWKWVLLFSCHDFAEFK